MPALFPCRCCGYRTLSSPGPASYEICPVCFWEDNDDRRGFAYDLSNAVSLTEGYRNFEAFGACEPEWRNEVRAPQASEARDAGWLPFAEQREVDRAALVEQISSAFGSLRILPGGMRLYEAELADGHGSEGPWALARKHDTYERVDEVPDEAIAQCYSSLSFFDPEGLRFHMGAYMGWAVRNPKGSMSREYTVSALTVCAGELEAWSKHRFALFDRAQCRAIVAFLRYLSRDDYLGKDAERALPYWQEKVASSS